MNSQVAKRITAVASQFCVGGLLLVSLVACGQADPQKAALDKAVRLMSTIVTSKVLTDAVQNADPQMHASTAASAALRGGITANFQQPPDGITILTSDQPTQPWSVVIKGDDVNQQVILEGYGDDITKPLVTEKINFPPR